jgi:hypothetical protein
LMLCRSQRRRLNAIWLARYHVAIAVHALHYGDMCKNPSIIPASTRPNSGDRVFSIFCTCLARFIVIGFGIDMTQARKRIPPYVVQSDADL